MSDEIDKKVEKAFEELVGKFPKRYKVKSSKYLRALLYALAEGDGYIDAQVDAVADNSLVVTASGKYLDRLGSLYGASRGRATGVQDNDFQKIIPVIGSNPKQIITTLQKVIDYIYGPYASHANTSCSAPAPYNLFHGSRLKVRVDDSEVEIFFKSSDAVNISQASAQEVATAVSERTQGRLIGSVVTNVRTGEQFLNIRTATIGSQGFVQVLGGEAQSAFRFPEIRPTRRDIGSWSISRFKGTDEMQYDCISGISPACRAAGVRIGDLVTISIDSGLDEKNCGTFKVSFVSENSFRVINPNGLPEQNTLQRNEEDFTFYRPDLGNILLEARPATIINSAQRELTVILPVTSPIVKRTLKGSHHFHSGISNIIEATSNSVTLASPAGFRSSGSFFIVGDRTKAEGIVSSVQGNKVTMITGDGWPSKGAFFSATERKFYYYESKDGNALENVWPSPPTSLAGTVVNFVKKYSFMSANGSRLLNVRPNPSDLVGFEAVMTTDLVAGFPGSFMYDRPITESPLKWVSPFEYDFTSGYAISNQSTHIEEKIEQGSSRTVLSVQDVESWDNEGYFMVDFGTKEEEGPIRYMNKVGQEAIIIDPGHVFKRDHLKGVSIRRIRHLGPAVPRINGQDLPVYITGTSQARSLLAGYLRALVAAGIVLKFKIIVPEQKWQVLPLLYSTDPLEDDLVIKDEEQEIQSSTIVDVVATQTVVEVFPVTVSEHPQDPYTPDPTPENPNPTEIIPPPPPALAFSAPVLGINTTNNTLNLYWGVIVSATNYYIFRDGSQIAASSGTSWTDNSAVKGKTYQYQVSAVKTVSNTVVESPRSNQVTATTMAQPSITGQYTYISYTTGPLLMLDGRREFTSGNRKYEKITLSWTPYQNDGVFIYTLTYTGPTSGTLTFSNQSAQAVIGVSSDASAQTYNFTLKAFGPSGTFTTTCSVNISAKVITTYYG